MNYNDDGTVKQITVKAGDTLPVGTEVDFDGTTIPAGWEEVTPDMKVLWTNPNPTASTFAAQSITLDESIDNYSYYEIIFIAYANASLSLDTMLSTGKILGERTRLFYVDHYARRRLVSGVSGTNMTFGDGGTCNTYGTDTWGTANGLCVPYQVIGYK